jgi:hypothetical protein
MSEPRRIERSQRFVLPPVRPGVPRLPRTLAWGLSAPRIDPPSVAALASFRLTHCVRRRAARGTTPAL